MDRLMTKDVIGFSFPLWSARWHVAEGCVTAWCCVSTIVGSTLAVATRNWSYTSKKSVSFPSRVINPKVGGWCIFKLHQMVFSISPSTIAPFTFQLTDFLIKIVLLTDYNRPVHLDREVGPLGLMDLEGKRSSCWFSPCRMVPICLHLQ